MATVYGRYAAHGLGTDRSDDWRHASLCRDTDPELHFPIGKGPLAQLQTMEAQQVCSSCPVKAECGDWALSSKQDHGIYGGMTADERKEILTGGYVPRSLTRPTRQCTRCANTFDVSPDRPGAELCEACANNLVVEQRKASKVGAR